MGLHLRATARTSSETRQRVRSGNRARVFLGIVRLVNGAGATFFPVQFSKRLGVDVTAFPSAIYALRMFGIRTLLIGGDLLLRRGDSLHQAILISPAIHAADAGTAIVAGVQGQLPRKSAAMGAAISLVNLGLAVKMVRGARAARRAAVAVAAADEAAG